MSYLDIYKKKLQIQGSNIPNDRKLVSQNIIDLSFIDDPSYKKAKLSKIDLTQEDIDIRVVNVDRSVSDKKIYVRPETVIDEGCVISYEDKSYLVTEFEDNLISPMCKCSLCNQVLKLPSGKEYPCVIANDSYGSKINLSNDFIGQIDTKLKIQLQANEDVLNEVKLDLRYIFNHSKFDIFKCTDINTSVNKGVITMIAKKDVYLEGLDDLENNMAFNGEIEGDNTQEPTKYSIIGNDEIKINVEHTYTINPIDEDIVFSLDEYSVENKTASIISQANGECIIKANVTDEIITLNCSLNGEIVATKDIVTVKR